MSPGVLALVVAAAIAHAGWNILAKGARGGAAFVWLSSVAAAGLYVPVLVVALVATPGRLGWTAIGLMAGSGTLHALYFVLLQRGYATGDLSLVYPLARGTGPLLSTAAAIVFLGERPSPLALAGAALIVGAVFTLIGRPRDSLRRTERSGERSGGERQRDRQRAARGRSAAAGFALLTGVTTAGYTLWDKHAVGAAGLAPIVYYWGTNLCNGLLLSPYVVRRPGALREAWATSRGRALVVGLLSPLAYVLVLFALARAPVSYVAPAREMSILIGTLAGTTLLAEGDTRRRLVAAGAILLGITALALG